MCVCTTIKLFYVHNIYKTIIIILLSSVRNPLCVVPQSSVQCGVVQCKHSLHAYVYKSTRNMYVGLTHVFGRNQINGFRLSTNKTEQKHDIHSCTGDLLKLGIFCKQQEQLCAVDAKIYT